MLQLRYAWARTAGPLAAALRGVADGQLRVTEALARAWQEAQRGKLTSVLPLKGAAMAPALGGVSPEALLVRHLPHVDASTVHRGDCVVLRSPSPPPEVLVRRIVALEGDEMVSDLPGDQPFVIPAGHAWVASDNQALPLKEAVDSRFFGPLPLSAITGRVLYSLRALTDHGSVANSEEAEHADSPVLAHELSVEELDKSRTEGNASS